jgi:glycosyltransferase involved in cell wall biosynthesis
MNVLYFTAPPLLDNSLEVINSIKSQVDLSLIIYISPDFRESTIFSVNVPVDFSGIVDYNEVRIYLSNVQIFDYYFEGLKKVWFIFYDKSLFYSILFQNYILFKIIIKNNFQILHFDDFSGRIFPIIYLFNKKSLFLTIHDPIRHSGENSHVLNVLRKLLFSRIDTFVTFSNFSANLLKKIVHRDIPVLALHLNKYLSYTMLSHSSEKLFERRDQDVVFLFFGRISQYKGIQNLLDSFSKIVDINRNAKLVIAGSGKWDYSIPVNLLSNQNFLLFNRHIDSQELVSLFISVDIVICPYLEATQSGVVMTAAAFKKPVIASNVGAMSEYIQKSVPGLLYNIESSNSLFNSIDYFLNNQENIKFTYSDITSFNRYNELITAYFDSLTAKINSN